MSLSLVLDWPMLARRLLYSPRLRPDGDVEVRSFHLQNVERKAAYGMLVTVTLSMSSVPNSCRISLMPKGGSSVGKEPSRIVSATLGTRPYTLLRSST